MDKTMKTNEHVNYARKANSAIKRCTAIIESVITELEANGGQPIRLENANDRITVRNKITSDVEWTDTEDIELKNVKSVADLNPALWTYWITDNVLEMQFSADAGETDGSEDK